MIYPCLNVKGGLGKWMYEYIPYDTVMINIWRNHYTGDLQLLLLTFKQELWSQF